MKLVAAIVLVTTCLFPVVTMVHAAGRNSDGYGVSIDTEDDFEEYISKNSFNGRRHLLGGTVQFLGGLLKLSDDGNDPSMTVTGSVVATSITDGTMTISGLCDKIKIHASSILSTQSPATNAKDTVPICSD